MKEISREQLKKLMGLMLKILQMLSKIKDQILLIVLLKSMNLSLIKIY